jgi:epoxyqueuosine reductase
MDTSWHQSSEVLACLQAEAARLGFSKLGITDTNVSQHVPYLRRWLNDGHQASMQWFEAHQALREDPCALVPNTQRVISVALDYKPDAMDDWTVLNDPDLAYISRYALGRDYHKLFRKRLAQLSTWLNETITPHGYRVFSDSAPILEKHLAEKAGLGWIGKHTLLLSRDGGSWFFLGEILTDCPLPVTEVTESPRCGSCTACLDICPTNAFVAPYQLDARKCISYLTIEHEGPIPEPLRAPMGNRVFGCDDCQLVCPWNRYSHVGDPAFQPRFGLDRARLIDLFCWDEATFLKATEGSPIRRAGYVKFLENIAIGLGNGHHSPQVLDALRGRVGQFGATLDEHIRWALTALMARAETKPNDSA